METINTSGRRKTAVARVYLKPGTGRLLINKRDISDYFTVPTLRGKVLQPFLVTEHEGKFDVTANIQGGGITGQAGKALSLAIAKALVELDAANKPALRTNGLVTRDPRMVERKKPGQKKAKRFQFSKR